MNTTATAKKSLINNFSAVNFLVGGKPRTILLTNVSWSKYENFLKDFENQAGWRLTYDEGKLEIMPPTPEHEEYSFSFHNFVLAYCEHFDINLEGRGSTTFRRQSFKKGVEPDECFYIQTAEKIAGKKLPAKNFPVPDVAVEIDVTTESLDKFPIYLALEVPEIWIYNGKKVAFYEREAESYRRISHSRALPKLSAEKLGKFLEMSRTKGQTAALKSFRKWLNLENK